MPTYRNDSSERMVVSGQTLEPGQIIRTNVYYNISGLTKISDEPYYNSVLLSASYTGDSEIDVPDAEQYLIELYAESGDWQIKWNVSTMDPVLNLPQGASWSRKFLSRLVDKIYVVGTGKIWVQIEKI